MLLDSKIKYSALFVFILTAYFSIGHHHSDEHFQILEFAQYKLGQIDSSDLPWEFQEKMRPSLQPWLAFVGIKILNLIHISNPFTITAIFRIISALFLWLIISKLNTTICKKYFPDQKWSYVFYFATYFLWFIPYLSVRFSSENYAQLFLLLSFIFILKNNNSIRNLIFTGVFLGLSVLFRYQMVIISASIFLWLLWIARVPLLKLMPGIFSFVLIILFGIFLDYLFYDEFVITSFQYLKLNLIEGRASDFGTSSWWYYMLTFLGVAVPPISLILFGSFLLGVIKLKNDVFTWSIIPFIIIHFLVAHKEMRFMFPVSYLFIFISIYGLMKFFRERVIKCWHRRLLRVSIGINMILLVFVIFRPANEMVANYKYLYKNIDLGQRKIITIQKDNYYLMAGLKSTFYCPDSYISDHIDSEELLSQYLNKNQIDTCFLVYRKFDFDGNIEGYKVKKVYSVYPDWLKRINVIDWQKVLKTHSINLVTNE